MARIRSVHPELFLDDAFMELSLPARLLAIGIWTHCDDHGVFEWKPNFLKATIMPVDTVNAAELLAELVAQNCVKHFEDSGRSYGAVRNFCLFQRPQKPFFKHPFPDWCGSYVALDRRKAQVEARNSGSATVVVQEQPQLTPVKRSHRRGEKGKGRGEEDSTNHIDKPVVVVVPSAPEAAPSTTTTTQVENELALQVETAEPPANPLGTALPEDWVPDDACIEIAHDHGMTDAELEDEVQQFHAYNSSRGAFSQNWNGTWTRWCGNFKRRKAAKAPPRVEVTKADPQYAPTERDWHSAVKIYAQIGRWNIQFGPEPTSPACKCPPDILAEYIINHAAVPVLAARAKVSA